MNALANYLLISSVCLGVFYLIYRLIISDKVGLVWMRTFLLSSILLSVLLPLHSVRVEIPAGFAKELDDQPKPDVKKYPIAQAFEEVSSHYAVDDISRDKPFDYVYVLAVLYMLIAFTILLRLIQSFIKIFVIRTGAWTQKEGKFLLVYSKKVAGPFSFFNWIFLNDGTRKQSTSDKIITHEKVHASQYHSIDILLIELLSAVMWFNPVVWLMRASLQQLHEYLADEGALDTGVSKPMYQALLLNQVAEERLITFSSGFNHSLIKKRIVMMTKPKFSQKANLKFLAIIPLAITLFIGIACVNGQQSAEKKTIVVVAPTKMNVLYLGVENPVSIAVSGYEVNELRVELDSNGRLYGGDGEYMIRPLRPGNLKVMVYAANELVAEKHFRVKTVPDPVAKVAGKKDGAISKEDLLKAGKVYVEMENFDFDLSFEVQSFVMSATTLGKYEIREEISYSEAFSAAQIDLIESLVTNQKLIVEEIKAKGPDGSIREMRPIVFNIQ